MYKDKKIDAMSRAAFEIIRHVSSPHHSFLFFFALSTRRNISHKYEMETYAISFRKWIIRKQMKQGIRLLFYCENFF